MVDTGAAVTLILRSLVHKHMIDPEGKEELRLTDIKDILLGYTEPPRNNGNDSMRH